ncbi:MAG: hypothetical protein HKM28_07505 [Flavobacteriaceae bacterium]|nr:hypothetical protein [Flavobacteriaceae bacterium]
MQKIVFVLALVAMTVACKNDNKTTTFTSDDPQYEGEFIYLADAAVLKGDNFIYGVELDDAALALAEQVETVKKDEMDMVPVVVKGIVNKKPEGEEGWDEIITITEIVSVSDSPAPADVKIEDKN